MTRFLVQSAVFLTAVMPLVCVAQPEEEPPPHAIVSFNFKSAAWALTPETDEDLPQFDFRSREFDWAMNE